MSHRKSELPSTQSKRPAPRAFWHRRDALISACACAAVVSVLYFSGAGAVTVLYHLLTDGLVLIPWLLSAWGFGALFLIPSGDDDAPQALTEQRDRPTGNSQRTGGSDRALRHVSAVAIGLGVISLFTLGLGLMGGLHRLTAILILGAGIALALTRLMPRVKEPGARELAVGSSWLWLLAMPFLGLALVASFVPPGILWGDEPNGYDVVEYHLQIPREWYELGRIVPLEHNVFSYFPFNVEMHDLLAMHLLGGPFKGMFLAQMMHLSFGVVSVLAVYAVVRSIAGRTSATIAAVAGAAVPWITLLAPIAYNESGLLLYATLAIGWALRSLSSRRPTRDLILAGAMAGLAAGVKLTAIPMLFIALPVSVLLVRSISARREAGASAGSHLARWASFLVVGTALFAPWALRNAVWTHGNPVFPEGQSLFGRAHFSEVQLRRWKQAHSPREDQEQMSARLRAALRQVVMDWRFGYIILPLGLFAFTLSFRRSEAWVLLLMLISLAVFWLGFTHLQGRFFVLAIPLSAMLIGLVSPVRWQLLLAGTVAVTAGTGFILVGAKWSEIDRSFIARTGGLSLTQLLGYSAIDRWTSFGYEPLAPDQKLVLVGDAEAFMYQMPMKQLRYRTVFDVDTSNELRSVIDAWTETTSELPGSVILVDPASLQRFQSTYYGIPPLPENVPGPRDRPFLLDQAALGP